MSDDNDWTQSIPNIEVEGLIAEGGMGKVFKARQVSLDRPVALKVLTVQEGDDVEENIELFRAEAKLLAQLDHTNIVRVLDFGVVEGHMYLVLELIEGGTLHDHIHAGNIDNTKVALSLFKQACSGLAYAHSKDVIHHDIKPSNVMVHKDGKVKLVDFGLADIFGKHDPDKPLMGTPAYVAPERLMEEAKVDHRADIYSMGALLYELLTKKAPEAGCELASEISDCPEHLDDVIAKCLDPDPNERYQTLKSLVSDLTPPASALPAKSAGKTLTTRKNVAPIIGEKKKQTASSLASAGQAPAHAPRTTTTSRTDQARIAAAKEVGQKAQAQKKAMTTGLLLAGLFCALVFGGIFYVIKNSEKKHEEVVENTQAAEDATKKAAEEKREAEFNAKRAEILKLPPLPAIPESLEGLDLVNRFTFDNTLSDSLEGESAKAGGHTVQGNKYIRLDGESGYVDLPNGLFSNLNGGFTIETWVEWDIAEDQTFQRIFDFGSTNQGEDPGADTDYQPDQYLALVLRDGDGKFGVELSDGVVLREAKSDTPAALKTTEPQHVVVSFNGNNNTFSLYLNGQNIAQGEAEEVDPTKIDDVNLWLGRPQGKYFPYTQSTFHEFRIFGRYLDNEAIQTNFELGPAGMDEEAWEAEHRAKADKELKKLEKSMNMKSEAESTEAPLQKAPSPAEPTTKVAAPMEAPIAPAVTSTSGEFLTLEEFNELPKEGTIDPNRLRYSRKKLGNVPAIRKLLSTIEEAKQSGEELPADFANVSICEHEGKIYVLENQTLYAHKKSDHPVRYKKIPYPPKQLNRNDSENEGVSIEVPPSLL